MRLLGFPKAGFFVISCALLAANPVRAQEDSSLGTVLSAPVSERCDLRIDSREASEWCWSLVCGSEGGVDLGSGLAALLQVSDLAPSPDRRWLAVLSVGEGHPILEVVDLQTLLTTHEYQVEVTINPYPGTINIAGWRDSMLLVTSDMPLRDLPIGEGDIERRMLPAQTLFSLDAETWTVR